MSSEKKYFFLQDNSLNKGYMQKYEKDIVAEQKKIRLFYFSSFLKRVIFLMTVFASFHYSHNLLKAGLVKEALMFLGVTLFFLLSLVLSHFYVAKD